MRPTYNYALSLTSQFPFCSMPLRLDSYSACQFACHYCFAAARGGASPKRRLQAAEPDALRRRLERVDSGAKPASMIDEMLSAKIPIHFGGMSDPFNPLEHEMRTTYKLLEVLASFDYPTVISTKSDICVQDEYIALLKRRNFVTQISLSSGSDELVERMDIGAPNATRRLLAIRALADAGAVATCRIQPVLPKREDDVPELIELLAQAGARHVSVEHLKLAVEPSNHLRLSSALGFDVKQYFEEAGSTRVGREWVLPVEYRVKQQIEHRHLAHRSGMLYGAADSDLLHLSDGSSCCSGVDLLGLKSRFTFTFTQAVRAARDLRIEFHSIADEWRPQKSIARYVNSKSRLGKSSGVEAYIRDSWNGLAHGASPAMYYGVRPTDEYDSEGCRIYQLDPSVARLMLNGNAPESTPSSQGKSCGSQKCSA
ncbi:DNA repair photolyase [Agrobacterium pusense]|uniref:SPL family radical SAM protein n=1 Tax=Agrobacterium pusense TaxID=648995 RepID=UPI00285456D0|nr:DNA repair photolyase [Agrobacterium pusense]